MVVASVSAVVEQQRNATDEIEKLLLQWLYRLTISSILLLVLVLVLRRRTAAPAVNTHVQQPSASDTRRTQLHHAAHEAQTDRRTNKKETSKESGRSHDMFYERVPAASRWGGRLLRGEMDSIEAPLLLVNSLLTRCVVGKIALSPRDIAARLLAAGEGGCLQMQCSRRQCGRVGTGGKVVVRQCDGGEWRVERAAAANRW